jgi:hypothetical protein
VLDTFSGIKNFSIQRSITTLFPCSDLAIPTGNRVKNETRENPHSFIIYHTPWLL